MSKQIEMMEYKKKIADLIRQINAIKAEKEKLLLTLQHLNISHQQGNIGYLEYSHRWSEILGGRTVEEYVSGYDRRLYELAAAKKSYSTKVRTSEAAEKKRDHNITLAASMMIILAVVAGFAVSPQLVDITGFAASDIEATISNATIQVYISIARSGNLSDGIRFGSLSVGTNDNNATDNYNTSDMTGYYILLSSDSNVNADFCIRANNNMLNNTVALGAGNMTWSNDTSNGASNPAGPSGSTPMTTLAALGDTNVAPGNNQYYRFWLDIPSDQQWGDYNNTIIFEAVQTGTGC